MFLKALTKSGYYYNYLILISSLIIIISPVDAITNQQVTFYSEPNKGGTQYVITEAKLSAIPEIINSQSFCVDLGLWKATMDGATPSTPISISHYGGTLGAEICRNRNGTEDNLWSFISWEFLGENDLETSSLSLFDRGNYMGNSEFADASLAEVSFPVEIQVRSYFITGTANYQIYSGVNYEGDVTCWSTVTLGGQFGAKAIALLATPVQVGSIRKGCTDDSSTTTRRPPTGGDGGSSSLSARWISGYLVSILWVYYYVCI